jgi:outer membrane lipopolysaccharide assembly protein LptE/RlpB
LVTRAAAERILAGAVLILGMMGSGCAYGLSGSLPTYLQTIRVSPFRSSVTEYGLEQELTSLVTEKLVMDGRLAIVTTGQNSELAGNVAAWARTPYSYTSAEQVEEYKLEIRLELTFTDLIAESDILDSESITTWIVYDPSAESEQEARGRLLAEAAEETVRRCLSGW